ncbi:FAD-binding domain-containing protein [Collybia nuda]|uniref:FAD-binding domain-containing protein n=1 Tax=Collybia nuda TaxID=64659 RepID=A0A9P5YC46_9AGAR|nr:FAD-binding domain-containing protein [Collybia nuda]
MMYVFLWLYMVVPALATSPITVAICIIAEKILSSASSVYYPGQQQYDKDINHWTISAAQNSVCSVEPGRIEDVSLLIKLLGLTRTPFAVKSGGHTANLGFSSTPGVQISLSRFRDISYNAKDKTATFGAGLVWDDVYAALAPYNVSLNGARVPGIGVGGFTLGGGYSYRTNQFGLAIDTVVSYKLVKPNGDIVSVTQASDPELFFGLKGGFNNFGIVTQFTLRAFPQGAVWGGVITYSSANVNQVLNALATFSAKATDPKAALVSNTLSVPGQFQIIVTLFYDAPSAPKGIFDDFLAIPSLSTDLSTRSMLSLIKAGGGFDGLRATSHVTPNAFYTPAMLNAIWNQTLYWGAHLPAAANPIVTYAIEPFLPSAFTRATSDSAYLSAKSRAQHLNPTGMVFAYTADPAQAAKYEPIFKAAIRESAAFLTQAAERSGQPSDAVVYPNYAIFDTPLTDIYGDNLPRLVKLKKRVDPFNVMGLAGGWKI